MKASKYLLLGLSGLIIWSCGRGAHMPLNGTPQKATQNSEAATFASVKGIFKNSCATCHNANSGLPDWADYAVAFAKKDRLYDRLFVKKDMPMGGKLANSDLKTIAAWLNAGAPPEPEEAVVEPLPPPEPEEVVAPTEPQIKEWPEAELEIKAIIEKNCTICHNADSGLPNWLDYSVVEANKDRLYDRVVVKKDMPMGLSMEESDRQIIQDWLDEKIN